MSNTPADNAAIANPGSDADNVVIVLVEGHSAAAPEADKQAVPIVATDVPANRMLAFWPGLFKGVPTMLGALIESYVYSMFDKLCPDYSGGSWTYVAVGEGAGYMFPSDQPTYDLACPFGNDWRGTLDARDAGIYACLMTLSALSMRERHPAVSERIAELYQGLNDYAITLPSWPTLRAALD